MINVATGQIKLDDYGVIFHLDLTLDQFRSSDIPPLEGLDEKKYSATYFFNAAIAGLNARFRVFFGYTQLMKLYIWENILLVDHDKRSDELVDARKISHERYLTVLAAQQKGYSGVIDRQLERLDRWLAQTTNSSPPFEYKWGEINSFEDTRGPDDPGIVIEFRREFPEGMDFKEFYRDRRERAERLKRQMKNWKQLGPGEFPPGFSRKTR
jgi:hypothetical protein